MKCIHRWTFGLAVAAGLALAGCQTETATAPGPAPTPLSFLPEARPNLQSEASPNQEPVHPQTITDVYGAVDAGRNIIDMDSE